MADMLKPLSKDELLRVTKDLDQLRQYLEKLVPFLYQELKRNPQNIVDYEKEYSTLLNSLQQVQRLIGQEVGWFSKLKGLIKHTEYCLEKCRQIKRLKVA